MSEPIVRITATDLDTGETGTKTIGAGDYSLIVTEPLYLAGVQQHGNGTVVLTLKRSTDTAPPTPTPTPREVDMPGFEEIINAWDNDAKTGGKRIHPLDPDDPQFWELGRQQAQQVTEYASPGDLVVDFGAGIGRLSIPLVGLGFDVLAVDASQNMLDALAARAAAAGVEVRTALSDGSHLKQILGRRKAHVIIARSVLIHHDYASVEATVTALAVALRKGGHLIADWPITTGQPTERQSWLGITTWSPAHRLRVAQAAGLEPVDAAQPAAASRDQRPSTLHPSVWRKA